MSASLTVSEIFGPTIQGEGRSVGKQAVFLRLGGCNLYCSWCDTAYTWRFSDTHPHQDNVVYDPKIELKRMDVQDIVDELEAKGLTDRRILVITGGEPLLQSTGIVALIKCLQRLSNWYGHIEIETNGTQMPLQTEPVYTNVYYNVSPKLANSGVKTIDRLNGLSLVAFSGLALRRFPREVIVKFVCRNDDDLKEIDDLLSIYRFPSDTIFVMPEGTDTATISNHTSQLVDKVIERGWNLTPRMHVDIWGKRRGV